MFILIGLLTLFTASQLVSTTAARPITEAILWIVLPLLVSSIAF
jgi:hypothetical protein